MARRDPVGVPENSGEGVTLRDPWGELQSSFSAVGTVRATAGQSLERIDVEACDVPASWIASEVDVAWGNRPFWMETSRPASRIWAPR